MLIELGPVRDLPVALTFAEYVARQNQRFIEELGIPAAMFRSVTTSRASSSIPNMAAGSVRRIIHDDAEEV